MNITIYHNPKCSKSRKTLEIIESQGLKPRIVNYLENPPTPDTIKALAEMLALPVAGLLRTSEADFAESPESVLRSPLLAHRVPPDARRRPRRGFLSRAVL